jgi:hypothetical protein
MLRPRPDLAESPFLLKMELLLAPHLVGFLEFFFFPFSNSIGVCLLKFAFMFIFTSGIFE